METDRIEVAISHQPSAFNFAFCSADGAEG
jgi:hypothetical protein